MNKSKFLILIIIGLLISNGIVLFMLFNKHSRQVEGPKNYIIDKLHFDAEQIKNYEAYIRQHRKTINEHERKMSKLRNDLFETLKYPQDTVQVDTLISIIAKQQYTAEYINYNHFVEIKNLCKPAQLKDFNELVTEIANLFASKERK